MSSLQLINLRANSLSGNLQVDMIMNSNIPSALETTDSQEAFPKEICALTKLKELYLGKNNLTGQIPDDIARLVSLEKLGLEGNRLNGHIPQQIGNCTYLMEIHMQNNNLTGAIPNEIGNLHALQELDLAFNNITGSIPSTFFNFSLLRKVNMAYNHLSRHLPSNTGFRLPNLEDLYLERNELSGPIPDSISNASKLIVLDLSSNSFSGTIPDSLGNLRNLQKLNLAENLLTSRSLHSELSFLSSLSKVQEFSLFKVQWKSHWVVGFRFPLGIYLNLLKNCMLLIAELQEIFLEESANLSNMIGLILQQNELTGAIPSEIGRLKHLQDFSLASNKLRGHIPDEICHLERLSYLYLLENGFSGSLPACLSNITSLRELYLGSNRFTSIPSSFWSLKDLLQINLSFNSLTGTLPLEIGNLKVVTIIDFSSNQLSGDIPTSITGLQNLAHFSLSDNRMQGPIPSSFGDLVSLEFLDLSSNNLSGAIPKSLEKLVHLKTFNVSFNRLQGEIPDRGSFANFSSRSFMDNEALCGPIRMQVPPCKSINIHRKSKRPHEFGIRYIVPAIASIILVIVFTVIIFRRSHKRKQGTQEDSSPTATWRKISRHELYRATEGFNETNLLGTGSCGSVYRGTLSDGLCIAVKVFHLELEGELMRFDSECEVLRMLRHRNLVKIISSC
ncbi:LEUCINE RICH REPEAT FAMILY PROTEIN EXPRESSED, partial [Salix purpurea]